MTRLLMEQLPIIVITGIIILFSLVLIYFGKPVYDEFFSNNDLSELKDIKSIEESSKEFFIDYKGCLNSNPQVGEDACICYIGVKKYGTSHVFAYSNNQIRLYNDETNKNILSDSFNGIVSCFLTIENNKIVTKETDLDLVFKGATKIRIKTPTGFDEFALADPLSFEKPFYRTENKLCFISPTLLNMEISKLGLRECK